MRIEARLRALCGIPYSTSQHCICTTWWSDRKFVRKEAELWTLCGTLYSTNQHCTTWWSDRKFVRRGRSLDLGAESYILPVDTVLYHTVVGSTVCEDRGRAWSSVQNSVFHQSTQYCTSRWSDEKFVRKEVGLRSQCGILYSSSQHCTTWWSDKKKCEERGGA